MIGSGMSIKLKSHPLPVFVYGLTCVRIQTSISAVPTYGTLSPRNCTNVSLCPGLTKLDVPWKCSLISPQFVRSTFGLCVLMNFRESVKSQLQMGAHLKPAVYVKSWGRAQNEHPCLWRTINTHTVLCAAIYSTARFHCKARHMTEIYGKSNVEYIFRIYSSTYVSAHPMWWKNVVILSAL